VVKFFNRRRRAFDRVPDFPLRCQHCEKPIRFVKNTKHIGPKFADEDGVYMCEAEIYLPHRPMPSISRLT
jgi:hypothetical protein